MGKLGILTVLEAPKGKEKIRRDNILWHVCYFMLSQSFMASELCELNFVDFILTSYNLTLVCIRGGFNADIGIDFL